MTTPNLFDPFHARDTFNTGRGRAGIYRLEQARSGRPWPVSMLPFSIRVLLEAVLRNCDGYLVTEDDVRDLAAWKAAAPATAEIPFMPARVVLQDFTGVPCVVDLAAMRSAMKRLGGDPKKINPLIPVDLVIDHSVQVDYVRIAEALSKNVRDRIPTQSRAIRVPALGSEGVRQFPGRSAECWHRPSGESGVSGQGRVSRHRQARSSRISRHAGWHRQPYDDDQRLGSPWLGRGRIEAEAAMLGQPLYMLLPEVVGFELTGELPAGATATDLVLTVTEILRKAGVVDKFVEFFGPGVSA